VAVRLIDVLVRAHLNFFMGQELTVYAFDSTNEEEPLFLGGAVFHQGSGTVADPLITKLPEITIANLHNNVSYTHISETHVTNFGQRQWAVFVLANDDAYMPDVTFVVVAAAMIFLVSTGLACWFYSSTKSSMDKLMAKAETEKALLMAESDREAAKNEREINDFIAHEVCYVRCRNMDQTFLHSGCCMVLTFPTFQMFL
jgi:hypothetical protein